MIAPVARLDDLELHLLDALPFYAMLVDSRHRVLYLNQAARRGLGEQRLTPETSCAQLMHGLAQPCAECPLELALCGGHQGERELLEPRSGRWLRVAVYPTSRRTPEGLPIWLHFAQDISELKALAEERDLLHRVEQIVADLLRIGLQPLTLDEQLARMLQHVLAVPWLGLKPRGGVFLVCDEQRTLELRASAGLDQEVHERCARVPAGTCLCGRAAVEGALQFSSTVDERHDLSYPGMTPHGHYCVPICSQECLLGVLCLYVEEGHQRSPREERFLGAVADVMANVIQHQRVLALFEQAAVGVAQLEASAGRLVRVNRRGCEILGAARDELTGRSLAELTHADDRSALLARLAELARGGTRELALEQRCQRAPGEVVWVKLTLAPMWPTGAAPDYLLAIVEDLTARKAAELALRDSDQRFHTLFEAMTEGVALHELLHERGVPVDYRLLDVNPAYEVQTGIRREAAVGRRATEVYGTSEAPYLDVFARVATTGVPARFEVHFEPLRRHFRVSVFSPGKDRFATVFEDITERRQMELALRARNEELDAFAHMVAHDLKTPLSVVTGYAELLRAGAATPAMQPQAVEAIARSSEKMARIIDELLLMAQVRQTEVHAEPLEMGPIVAASLSDLAELLEQRRGAVTLPERWPVALGHAPWVQQVWVNYLGNALKHGGQPPRAELGAVRQGDGMVCFWIKDNGAGLSAEERARLFVPFSRPSARAEGHGLGLSIVRRIVEKLGGSVGVEAGGLEPTGSTFTFTLPEAPPARP